VSPGSLNTIGRSPSNGLTQQLSADLPHERKWPRVILIASQPGKKRSSSHSTVVFPTLDEKPETEITVARILYYPTDLD
jgi:hypothetical protein